MKFVFLTLVLLSGSLARAHQPRDGDIYGSVGTFGYMTHQWRHNFQSPQLIGPMIAAEADLYDRGGLEISMFYLKNSMSVLKDGHVITQQIKRMYISTGYRHWFSSRWSGGVAFASSYSMGNPETLQDDFGTLPRPNTSASDITEYGVDLSVQYEFWRSGRFAGVADARYGAALTNKRGEDENHMGIAIALKYFIQSREKIADDELGE